MSRLGTPSRWCPTPEQVMILEEIYKNGLKTPNATQIQHITSHLSLYGKIEGKNVFYWFQNHKARDRQKLRRKLYKQFHHQQLFMTRHRFHEQHFFQYFLPQHQQHIPQPLPLPLPPGCFGPEGEGEEGSTVKEEGERRTWFDDDDDGMTTAGAEAETTCRRRGSLRTLELFPVRGSCMKEEESGNGGWRN